MAYFRAPPPFLGPLPGFFGGTLVYSLHVAAPGGQLPSPALAPLQLPPPSNDTWAAAPPDVLLLGGRLLYNDSLVCPLAALAAGGGEPPPGSSAPAGGPACVPMPNLRSMDKPAVLNWSQSLFPELPLNPRWTRDRVVGTVLAYVQTPLLALAAWAPEGPGYPPVECAGERCITNFNFALGPTANWTLWPFVPAGFGWAGASDGRQFIPYDEGPPFYAGGLPGPAGGNVFGRGAAVGGASGRPASPPDAAWAAGWGPRRPIDRAGSSPWGPPAASSGGGGADASNSSAGLEPSAPALDRLSPWADPSRDIDFARMDWDVVPEVQCFFP